MLLFGVPDGQVDRFDRAAWLTGPFDLAFIVEQNPTQPSGDTVVRRHNVGSSTRRRAADVADSVRRRESSGSETIQRWYS